jgi:uncharacterized membrane protein SirB2
MYLAFKGLHLITLTASVAMFFVRGLMLIQGSPRLESQFIRGAPNIIDGLLIVSALGLAITIGWYPFANAWVTAKLLATIVYLGLVHAGFSRRSTGLYWAGLLPLAYIGASVACRDPLACLGTP